MDHLSVVHPARYEADGEKRWERLVRHVISTSFAVVFLIGCDLPTLRDESSHTNSSERSRREIVGKRLYQTYCSGCHGETGEGDGMHSYTLNPPPGDHTDSSHMDTLSNEYLFRIISDGGPSVGRSPEMPPWKHVMNKNDIENIIICMRGSRGGTQSLHENSSKELNRVRK